MVNIWNFEGVMGQQITWSVKDNFRVDFMETLDIIYGLKGTVFVFERDCQPYYGFLVAVWEGAKR